MSADPFAKPQKLLDWAHGSHNSFKGAWEGFILNAEHRLVAEENLEGGYVAQKVVISGDLPSAVEEHATVSLNHLRNAYDQMLFAACRAIGRPIRDGHYPWTMNPKDLEHRLFNKKTGKETIPREFWDLIRRQKPYPASDTYEGGDSLVRAVAALANTKHTIGLEMTAVAHVNIGSVTFRGPGSFILTGMPTPPQPIPYKDGIELMRWTIGAGGPDPGYNYRIEVQIGFDEAAPSELRFVPVSHALVEFGMHAQACLNGFKSRADELI